MGGGRGGGKAAKSGDDSVSKHTGPPARPEQLQRPVHQRVCQRPCAAPTTTHALMPVTHAHEQANASVCCWWWWCCWWPVLVLVRSRTVCGGLFLPRRFVEDEER